MEAQRPWSRFSADPRDPGASSLRATDADRDVAVDVLREAYADGRLSREEYDDRASAALGARTISDVLPLMVDLAPTDAPSPTRPVAADLHGKAVAKHQRDLRNSRNGFITLSALTTSIWGATSLAGGGPYFFWPVFPIIAVGIGYLSNRLNGEERIEDIENKLAETRRTQRELD